MLTTAHETAHKIVRLDNSSHQQPIDGSLWLLLTHKIIQLPAVDWRASAGGKRMFRFAKRSSTM